MARRTFDVIDITEILMHWHAGRSKNEMAESLGVDRKTLRKYMAPAEAAGIEPGRPGDERGRSGRELVRELVPGAGRYPAAAGDLAGDRAGTATTSSAQLKAGVTVATIHQRLRDEHGLAASAWRASAGMCAANLPEEARRAQVTVLEPAAGRGRVSRRRSTTGSWAGGSTRSPGSCARCGRS